MAGSMGFPKNDAPDGLERKHLRVVVDVSRASRWGGIEPWGNPFVLAEGTLADWNPFAGQNLALSKLHDQMSCCLSSPLRIGYGVYPSRLVLPNGWMSQNLASVAVKRTGKPVEGDIRHFVEGQVQDVEERMLDWAGVPKQWV